MTQSTPVSLFPAKAGKGYSQSSTNTPSVKNRMSGQEGEGAEEEEWLVMLVIRRQNSGRGDNDGEEENEPALSTSNNGLVRDA